MNLSIGTPRDAAAVILYDQNRSIYLVRRSEKLTFLGGFHAFAGGQREKDDENIEVSSSKDRLHATMMACAARELFEEIGVLLARGAERLTKGQRESLRDDLISKRMTFSELLSHYDLTLHAEDFNYAGRWLTPPFSPVRFNTWFFLASCPQKQRPVICTGELEQGEWIRPADALRLWLDSKIVIAPPTLHALRTMARGFGPDLPQRLESVPEAQGQPPRAIEFHPGFVCFPLETPTRPPSTHTNCYIIGNRELVVIDPGSPYRQEQEELNSYLDQQLSLGKRVKEILITHLHPDHIGGVEALRSHLRNVPVAAHSLTASAIDIRIDRFVEENELISLKGDPEISLRAMHTPGHARGHLCFYSEPTGSLITGDNIIGIGTVLIDPPEGNMRDYLNSLERLRSLPKLSVLLGGHGPAMANPKLKIEEYIKHRLQREQQIIDCLDGKGMNVADIVSVVYKDIRPEALDMAARSTIAHLEKLSAEERVEVREALYFQI
jgi:endoribonuclease LACTB2